MFNSILDMQMTRLGNWNKDMETIQTKKKKCVQNAGVKRPNTHVIGVLQGRRENGAAAERAVENF